MDFVVVKMSGSYGYISTGKEKCHGFCSSYDSLLQTLDKKYGEYTFANPEELAVRPHQRDWTKVDNIYVNKLKHYHDKEGVDLMMLMLAKQKMYS